jgi:hypothetical protein
MVSLKFHDESLKEDFIEVMSIPSDKSVVFMITKGNKIDESTNIYLDKSTAIKLSKELRKQIALLF